MNQLILLVEDNEDDAFFMQRALRQAGIEHQLQIIPDGQQALDYLGGTGKYADRNAYPLPSIVFLDIKLPYKSGLEVLGWIRQQPDFEKLIVIVLTSSSEPIDLKRAYQLGANSFVVKPPTSEQLLELASAFKLWWLKQNKVVVDLPPA